MIDLQKLALDGWMSYDKETYKLNNIGITRIQGEIGAGKSAIPEAIFYLLFGKTLRNKESVDNLVNKVLNNGYDIKLWFTLDNIPCAIREIRGRAKHGLYFYVNGKDKRGKTDPETRKKIIDTLGMSAEDFRSIALLGQRQSQLLVEGKPAERAKAIVDIFSLTRYDELITACDTDLKEVIQEKKTLIIDAERYTQELENLENSLLDSDLTVIDSADIAVLESKIDDVAKRISKIRRLADHIQTVITTASTLDDQRQHARKLSTEIEKLKAERARYKKPDMDITEIEDILDDLQQDYSRIKQKMMHAQQELSNAKAMKDLCPINNKECPVHVPLENKTIIIKKYEKQSKTAQKDGHEIEREIQKTKKAKELIRVYTDIETAIRSKKDAMSKMQKAALDKIDIKKEKATLAKYKESIEKGNEKLTNLITERTEKKAAFAVYQEKQSIQAKIKAALSAKEQAITNLNDQISAKSIEAQYLAGVLAIFKKMKVYKIDLVLQLLNVHLKEILEKISDEEYKAEFVSQRLGSDKKRKLDKISIIVYDSYKALPIELCSGGQSIEVGLAVLLSTWKTANAISHKGVSSLWLDEAFGPLDEDVIDRVFDSVIKIANELGTTAVYVISHRDLDSRLFNHFWNLGMVDGITVRS
jgi:DNA repair exonuclease SbcCD ATPase subunit